MPSDHWILPSLDEWNEAIAGHFFNEDHCDRDVVLCVDSELIDNLFSDHNTADFINALEEECAQLPPGERNPLSLGLERQRAWSDRPEGYPPYIATLAVLVLAAGHDQIEFSENAYWGRLEDLRRQYVPDVESVSHTHRRLVEHLFCDLMQWSCIERRGELGRFEFRRLGHWRFVGLIRGQALLSDRDRRALERSFAEHGFLPDRPPSRVELVRAALNVDSQLRVPTRRLLANWPNGPAIEALVDHIEELLLRWDGTVSTSTGNRERAQIVLPALIELRPTAGRRTCSLLRADAAEREMPDELVLRWPAKGRVVASFASGRLSEPLSLLDGDGDTVDASTVDWSEGLRLQAEEGGAVAGILLPAREIRFFVRENRAWTEEAMLPDTGPCVIACGPDAFESIRQWAQDQLPSEGMQELDQPLFPGEWRAIRVESGLELEQARSAFPRPGLAVAGTASIQVSGGVRTASGRYLVFALPVVRVRNGGPGASVRLLESFDAAGRPTAAVRLEQMSVEDARPVWRLTANEDDWANVALIRLEAVDASGNTIATTAIAVETGEWVSTEPLFRDHWGRVTPHAGNGDAPRVCGLQLKTTEEREYPIGDSLGQTLPPSESRTDSDRFVRILATRGTLAWPTGSRLVRSMVDEDVELDAGRMGRSVSIQFEAMRALGLLEIEEDETGHFGKIVAMDPSVHLLPTRASRWNQPLQGVVAGTYSTRQLAELLDTAARHDVEVHIQQQPAGCWLVPDRVSLIAPRSSEIETITEEAGWELIRQPFAATAVSFLRPLEAFLEQAPWRAGPPPHEEGRRVFDVRECRTRPETEVDGELVLAECREPYGIGRRSYWLHDRERERCTPCPRQLGRWVVALCRSDGPRALPVSGQGELCVPIELRPPLLVERALCACSGLAPQVMTFKRPDLVDLEPVGLPYPPSQPAEWLAGSHVYSGHWLFYQRVTMSSLVQRQGDRRVLLPLGLRLYPPRSQDISLHDLRAGAIGVDAEDSPGRRRGVWRGRRSPGRCRRDGRLALSGATRAGRAGAAFQPSPEA